MLSLTVSMAEKKEREQAYEANLTAYEKSAVKANIWSTAFPRCTGSSP